MNSSFGQQIPEVGEVKVHEAKKWDIISAPYENDREL